MGKRYICEKDKNEIVSGEIKINNESGFKIKPKNNIEDGIEVSELILLEPYLIECVLKRKTKIKLNAYLKFLISIIEEEGDDGDLALVLEDTKRYKALIMDKYSKYLSPKYIKELLFRVKFVEEELKAKIYEQQLISKSSKGR